MLTFKKLRELGLINESSDVSLKPRRWCCWNDAVCIMFRTTSF